MKKEKPEYPVPAQKFKRNVVRTDDPPYLPLPMIMVRFWKKVEMNNETECWLWKGATSPAPRLGYGMLRLKTKSGVKIILAHRIALAMRLGRWPNAEELALHSCHVRSCVNPLHIRPGTHLDNYRDCVFAKRAKIGVLGHDYARRATTLEIAKDIILLYYGDEGNGFYYKRFNIERKWNITSIAERFNVPKAVIMRVIVGKSKTSILISDDQRAEAVRLWRSDEGQGSDSRIKFVAGKWNTKTLAAKFKLSEGVVGAIIEGRTYRSVKRPYYHPNWLKKGRVSQEYAASIKRRDATN